MHEQVVMDHTKMIAEVDARSKSNTKRSHSMERIVDAVHEMNGNIKVIVEQTRQQQEDITGIVDSLKHHEDRIDGMENKQDKDARKLLLRFQWLLISLLTSGVFYFVWETILKKGS